MKKDKFLTGIIVAIVLLMVLAIALFFMRQSQAGYLDESSPEGVVHNFIYAIQQKDYEKAYSYVFDSKNKPEFSDFRQFFIYNRMDDYGIQIGETRLYDLDQFADVSISIIEGSNGPFDMGYRSQVFATLRLQEGVWRIEQLPYQLWSWDWIHYP